MSYGFLDNGVMFCDRKLQYRNEEHLIDFRKNIFGYWLSNLVKNTLNLVLHEKMTKQMG